MTGKDKAILILEKKLGKAYRNIAVGDLERLLRAELDKSAEEMDTVLVHSLLDILEPTDSIMGDEAVELAQLSAEIEAEIAARTFVTSGGKPFSFETVCDDVAYLMVEQYEKRVERINPYEIQLIREAAAKGEAALFIVVSTVFLGCLDEAILGAIEGAYEYLMVTDDLVDQTFGEDIEIARELSTLHMDSIKLLLRYAELGVCDNIDAMKAKAEEAQERYEHVIASFTGAI